ncbi:MAG: flagellar basal body-associated FliL family protein [Alphaproteobacteria bacterium]|nr:flagellar basal body-associated FliL family protein [Alphaproteobacteria bacterium]
MIIVLLLLIGGGAGGYFFLRSSAPPPPAAEPASPDPIYLSMETFVIPIMRGGIVDGFVRLDVTLEVPDYDVRREVDRVMPRLRNAILADLHALVALRRNPTGRLSGSDIATIKSRLMRIIETQVGPDRVKAVLLEEAHDIPPGGIKSRK